MPTKKLDKESRRLIIDSRNMIQQALKDDCNESETRRRIERMFESLMGYDPFKHLSRERAVRGAGETEHVDFTIQVDESKDARPLVMVEIKRIAIDLAKKHLKQVTSYAIDAGCEWCLLTNGREWKLHHVTFGQPPETQLVRSWNVLTDEPEVLDECFKLISLRSLKKNALAELWQKTHVMLPENLLDAIFCEDAITAIRRQIRRKTKITIQPEEIVAGVRRLLNETALTELETMRITFPTKKPRKKRVAKKKDNGDAIIGVPNGNTSNAPNETTLPIED